MTNTESEHAGSRTAMAGEIGILARRRIEAGIIAPIYEEMRNQVGEELAQSILDTAIPKAAITAGKDFTARTPGGTTLRTFQELQDLWTQDSIVSDNAYLWNFPVILRPRPVVIQKNRIVSSVNESLRHIFEPGAQLAQYAVKRRTFNFHQRP